MTKNIRENPLSSEKNHYLKRALSNEENAENGPTTTLKSVVVDPFC